MDRILVDWHLPLSAGSLSINLGLVSLKKRCLSDRFDSNLWLIFG